MAVEGESTEGVRWPGAFCWRANAGERESGGMDRLLRRSGSLVACRSLRTDSMHGIELQPYSSGVRGGSDMSLVETWVKVSANGADR